MAGDWSEEKHPRAEDGKFGAGGGPRSASAARIAEAGAKRTAKPPADKPAGHELTSKDHARIAKAKDRASEQADFDHMMSRVPEGKSKEQHASDLSEQMERDEHEAIVREKEAVSAGHVGSPATPKIDAYEEFVEKANGQAKEVHSELVDATAAAADAVAKVVDLHYEDSYGTIGSEDADAEMGDQWEAVSQVADLAKIDSDRPAHESPDPVIPDHLEVTEPEDEDPGKYERDPSIGDDEHEEALADHEEAVARFQEQKAARDRAFKARQAAHKEAADEAQAKLEALHAAQIKALDALKAQKAAHKTAKKGAESERGKIDPEELVKLDPDESDEADYDRATKAAESIDLHLDRRLEDIENAGDDRATAISVLNDAARSTAAAIRDMAKVSKRAAVISKGKATGAKPRAAAKVVAEDDEDESGDE